MIHGCLHFLTFYFQKYLFKLSPHASALFLNRQSKKIQAPVTIVLDIKFILLKEASLWLCGSSLVEIAKQCSKWRKNYALQR